MGENVHCFDRVEEIFTPNSPINNIELLAGRDTELAELRDIYKQPGAQITVVGDPGVGKTSLILNSLKGVNYARINCFKKMNFDSFSKATFHEFGKRVDLVETLNEKFKGVKGGFNIFTAQAGAEGGEKTTEREQNLGSRAFDQHLFFQVLKEIPDRTILFIDHYEVLKGSRTGIKGDMADLIKCMSDQSDGHKCTIIIVGVAKNTSKLLGKQVSIHRSINEIKVQPLQTRHIFDFLGKTETIGGFWFEPSIKADLAQDSMGYPYFTHLVGLHTMYAMRKRVEQEQNSDPLVVSWKDYYMGKKTASQRVFRTNLKKYGHAVSSLSREEQEVLKFINTIKTNEISAINLFTAFENDSEIRRKKLTNALHKLEFERKIIHEVKTLRVFKFADPLLRPFLRIKFGFPDQKDYNQMTLEI